MILTYKESKKEKGKSKFKFKMLDARQIVEDLIPICLPDGSIFIGKARRKAENRKCQMSKVKSQTP
jgi:hypothetical protein